MRLIDADELLNELTGVEVMWWAEGNYTNYDDTTIAEIINNLPTIEAAPVVHGEWIDHEFEDMVYSRECSECHYEIPNMNWNFCPNCGVDMRTKEN